MLRLILILVGLMLHPAEHHPVRGENVVDAAIERTIALDCLPHHRDGEGDWRVGALGDCTIDAVGLKINAWEEGQFCLGSACARGDDGKSVSTFQVMILDVDKRDFYENNMLAASRRAYYIMRAGAESCPAHPLAPYCGGCNRRVARFIGDRRLARARQLLEAALESTRQTEVHTVDE